MIPNQTSLNNAQLYVGIKKQPSSNLSASHLYILCHLVILKSNVRFSVDAHNIYITVNLCNFHKLRSTSS
jgi:hypothetical protein